jgi:hypothetical protein
MPVAEPAQLEAAQRGAGRGQLDRLRGVGRDPRGAGEVVRRAARDDGQRDAEAPGEVGHRRDRAVAARHHEPVGLDAGGVVLSRDVELDLGAMSAQRARQRIGVGHAAGGRVRNQRDTHGAAR